MELASNVVDAPSCPCDFDELEPNAIDARSPSCASLHECALFIKLESNAVEAVSCQSEFVHEFALSNAVEAL